MSEQLPTHPHTGLTALGIIGDRPVWPAMGGDGTGDGDTGQNSNGDTGNGGENTPPADPPAPPADPAPANAGDLESLDQADLARMVRDLRRENGAARTQAKATAAQEAEQALTQKLAAALGLGGEGAAAPSADDLTQKLAERDAEVRTLRTERAAETAIRTAGGDIDTMLDSRAFTTKLGDLDPEADSFADDLAALVAAEVKANPRYQASGAPAAPRSGGDFSGGSGTTSPTFTDDQIKNMSPAEYAQNRDAIMAQLGGA